MPFSHSGELLESLPPGVDEAVAISKVVQLANSEEYSTFSHVVFDTAPTGHTLRLLTLPEFLDATIGKPCKFCPFCALPSNARIAQEWGGNPYFNSSYVRS